MVDKIVPLSEAESFIECFESLEISHVWRGAGTSIFLELGALSETKTNNPSGEFSFSIEWSWRVENTNSILVGSFSEDEDLDMVTSLLVGKRLRKARFFGRLKEIQLELDNDIWFCSFATSDGSPEWAAKNSDDEWLYFRKGKFIIEKNT